MRNLRIFRPVSALSTVVFAVAGSAGAQDAAPPADAAPVPETAPEAAPAPAPSPPPPPQPAPPPTYAPPPAYPPAGPPPGYAQYPAPASAPQEPPLAEGAAAFKPGPYFGLAGGYGAPLGAQQIFGGPLSISGGVGVLVSAGYQISSNFGLGAFGHWNNAATKFIDIDDEPDEISAWVLFYGIEARAGFFTKAVDGWASLGLALGTGSMTLRDEETSCFIGPSGGPMCTLEEVQYEYDVTFGPMATIAFGATAKLSPQWGFGPVFRMYFLNVTEACAKVETDSPNTAPADDSECTSDMDEVLIPNVAFAGLELVFRP
jgi:hypothetical protein